MSDEPPKGKHYVYKLAYPDGRIFYIGKGTGNRIHQHEVEARTNKTHNSYKVNVIRKIWRDGGEVLKSILSYFASHEEACEYEIALIFLMRGYGHLTNISDGGDGVIGVLITEEGRQKLREFNTGRTHTEEARQKIREARAKQVITEETRRKLSKANRGRKHSAEAIRKMSLAQKMRPPMTEETRRKIGEAGKGRKIIHSAETRRKISERLTGKPQSEEHRRKNREGHLGQIPPNKGIPMSPEAKRKMIASKTGTHVVFTEEHKYNLKTSQKAIEQRRRLAEYNRGRALTEERRRKISEANRGKPHPLSETARNRLIEYNKSRRGKPRQMSEEWRKNITESNKRNKTGKKTSEETKQKMREAHKARQLLKGKASQLQLPDFGEAS